jgi:formate hydrogenlyase subunit 3/multisubunit Na+/H+ antiporter MnhD subunit
MALARPFLYLLEEMAMSGAWAWIGAGAALFTAAGLPPSVGFAARLLVLGSAFHLHPLLALAVVAGVVIEVFASARLLLRLGIPLVGPGPRTGVAPVAIAVAILALIAGLVPGGVLAYVWNLG